MENNMKRSEFKNLIQEATREQLNEGGFFSDIDSGKGKGRRLASAINMLKHKLNNIKNPEDYADKYPNKVDALMTKIKDLSTIFDSMK